MLGFGNNPTKNINKIADNIYFQDAIELFIEKDRNPRKVFNTYNLDRYILKLDEPRKVVQYYYKVRSNITHRGKGIIDDYKIILKSYKELLKITEYVISKTTNECTADLTQVRKKIVENENLKKSLANLNKKNPNEQTR